MKSHILIHTALAPEAKPIVEQLKLKKHLSCSAFDFFTSDQFSLIVSGMGKVKTASALTAAFYELKSLCPDSSIFCINIGCAAAPETFKIGDLLFPIQIIDQANSRRFYPDVVFKHPGSEITLETREKPATDSRQVLGPEVAVDMEASSFFETARLFTSSSFLFSFKVVSDHYACSIPSKEFISDLIKNHIPEMFAYFQNLIDYIETKEGILDAEELHLLAELNDRYKLTSSQQRLLREDSQSFKVLGGELFTVLESFLTETKDKTDRKQFFSTIRSSLVSS